MLENKKNVRKIRDIVIVLIALIMILGFFIKFKNYQSDKIEIETIATKSFEHVKSADTEDVQSIATLASIDLETGKTINPYYRPEWEKVSSTLNIDSTNVKNSTIDIVLKGLADKTDGTREYSSTVTSTLETSDITVYINGIEDGDTNGDGVVDSTPTIQKALTELTTTSEVDNVQYKLTLSNFVQDTRQSGAAFKEWSGNISLKIKGRGEASTTYTENVLVDKYGNQSMMATDEVNGTWIDITFDDTDVTSNTEATTNGAMFTDFIIPEFTYKYSTTTTIIGSGAEGDKKVTVIFDVVDKYFNASTLVEGDIGVKVADDNVNLAIQKELTKTADVILNTATGVTRYETAETYTLGTSETKVGERYQLVITGLEQRSYDADGNYVTDGTSYSGPMALTFPAGKVTDKSGNENVLTAITIGVDETDGNANDSEQSTTTKVDVVDPVWKKAGVTFDGNDIIIKLQAKDKYFDTCTIDTSKIKVYVNGVLDGDENNNGEIDAGESSKITKDITSIAATDITDTVDGVANTVIGKEYTLKLSNITVESTDYTTFEPENKDELNQTVPFKYRTENGGEISITIEEGTIKDKSENISNEQNFEIGIADNTKPEMYEVQKIQDTTAKTETIIFNVTDRNFYTPTDGSKNEIEDDEITVSVDGTEIEGLIKSLTHKEIKLDIDDEENKVLGHQYTLVLDLSTETANANGYLDYSGTISIEIAQDAIKDTKGNILDSSASKRTISDFVDFIKPVIEQGIVANPIDTANKTYTMSFTAIDKYIDTDDLIQPDEITIYVDGEEATGITIEASDLTSTPIQKTISKTIFNDDGTSTVTSGIHTIGHTYTLVLSGFEVGKLTDASGNVIRNFKEWSGTVTIEIDEGAVKDTGPKGDGNNPNLNPEKTITGEHVDFIKPVIEKVSSTPNTSSKTETIIFNVMDKYLDTSDALLDSEITIYVDDEKVENIITKPTTTEEQNNNKDKMWKELTKTATFVMNKTTKAVTTQSGTYTIDGTTEQVVGYQYELVLSNFEQPKTAIDTNREYSDWSGTVEIEFAENAVKDTTGINTLSANVTERTIKGDFVDFIKPNVTYEYSDANIVRNHEDKTLRKFTMVFDITDKYFTNSTLATEYTNATTDDAKLAVLQNYLTIMVGEDNVTNVSTVIKKITNIEDVIVPLVNKTVSGIIQTDLVNQVVGKRFTLEISNLEQDIVALDKEYLDYSGIVTVAIDADDTTDTSLNGNVDTTITSGYTIASGTVIDSTSKVIDLVDPLWEIAGTVTAQPKNKTATIPIKGTDKYIATNNLQESDVTITVTIPGDTIDTFETITVAGNQAETKGMTFEITSETINYGKKYTLSLNGYSSDAYQVKITLRDGILVDESGNTSQATEFILFSSLKETSTETAVNSGFLRNTNIERQKIEQVIFKDDLIGINSTRWDVSQLQDQSIWGWYETTDNGTYKVYIGSYIIINGNVNSSYLFANLGRDVNCAITGDTTDNEIIKNLDLLHVDGVENMSHMFDGCGYTKMQSLDLGAQFDTTCVTDMSYMFQNCGNIAMTSLDLGEKFDTTNVTNMSNMFNGCGQNAMTSFAMGGTTNTIDFNTSNVTNMSSMFQNFGQKLGSLTLGENFNTSIVTDMSNMFNGCGQTSIATLDLGDNFNTAKVQNMSGMFQGFAQNSTTMTSLDLGDLFYTTSATNMSNMFNGCGTAGMTSLDLGPAFTKIASTYTGFATNCGTSTTVIKAPESIYSNMKNFKLNTNSDTTITLSSTQGTINPYYRPEWTKVSSTLDLTTDPANPTMTIVVKGSTINYTSDLTETIDTSKILVYVDGELDEGLNGDRDGVLETGETPTITKSIEKDNDNTTATEIYYKITLSNFEEASRRSGKSFKELSGNISLQFAKGTLKDMYGSQFDADGNFENVAGNSNLAVIDTAVDTSGATTQTDRIEVEDTILTSNTTGKMFADTIKPEFTYKSTNTTIGSGAAGDEKVTVVFDVTDKYFSSSSLATDTTASLITVQVDSEEVNATVNVNKTLTQTADLIMNTTTGTITEQLVGYSVGTSERKVGERYKLEITGLDTGDGFAYSGPMTLSFTNGLIEDNSGNSNPATTITIGVNEEDGNANTEADENGIVVDVVDPIWKVDNIDITENEADLSNSTATLELTATDKYYSSNIFEDARAVSVETLANTITKNILVYIDGELDGDTNGNGIIDDDETPTIVKTLSTATNLTPNGTGVKYTLTLTNWDADKYSGTAVIKILANSITDQSTNTSNDQEFTIGHIDFIKPVVEHVSSTPSTDDKSETIIFNVKDKYLNTSDLIGTDTDSDGVIDNLNNELIVYIDGVAVDTDDISIRLERVSANDVSQTINSISRVVLQQYKLVLSDFEETTRNGKDYKDWSGTVLVEIAEGAVSDIEVELANGEIAGGNVNDKTTLEGDFVDFINPDLKYTHQSTDISTGSKIYTMTFDVTDKYYTSGELSLDNFTIKMKNGQMDLDGNAIIYDLKNELPANSITLTPTPMYLPAGTKVTDTSGNVVTATENSYQIGYSYTLTISNLEELEVENGKTTADYSGVITVAVDGDIIADRSENKNVETTITSGVNIPGGTIPGDAVAVDVVSPIWTKVSSSANAIDQTATVTFKGTDTYFKESTLTSENVAEKIEVYVNGNKVTSGLTLTLSAATPLEEQRLVNNGISGTGTTTVQYGVQYTLTITGFAKNANQVKIKILEGTLKDETTDADGNIYSNVNKDTEMILYNCLELTSSETAADSNFLGNSNIDRQDVEKVIFVQSVADAPTIDENICWDASAQGDQSILAWRNDTAPYTVYIGSDDEIFANQNSSYLFSYIGYSESCDETAVITGLEYLNTNSVTNMSYMFQYAGYNAMGAVDFEDDLDTTNVTNMSYMFYNFGYKAMTSLKLGSKFNTSSVTNMSNMFNSCGYTTMQSIDFGSNFNTSSVTNMASMFASCGYGTTIEEADGTTTVTGLTSLDLGATGMTFNTSNVTNMSSMFNSCGYTAMTTLELGSLFNTSSVTTMANMFYACGHGVTIENDDGTTTATGLTTLDLGDNFNTINVTTMTAMFRECGYTAMTSIDLGENFDTRNVTGMMYMFDACGEKSLKSLDLGNKFYTTKVTNMGYIFCACGKAAMESLDLGPAFTRIPENTNGFIDSCGKSGAVIYAAESIYNDMKKFKLSTDSDTTITYTQGTINPIYKPEWEYISSTLDLTTNPNNPTMTIVVKGSANHIEDMGINDVKINYTSNVTSTLPTGTLTSEDDKAKINVYVDDELAESITKTVELDTENTTATEIYYKITLSGFEQTSRGSKPFKEWAGNISLQFAKGTIKDMYGSQFNAEGNFENIAGNSNLAVIDIDTSGTTENIEVEYEGEDAPLSANTSEPATDAKMFSDVIKPEFTYKSSDTIIGNGAHEDTKIVTVVFDVTDKYFNNTTLATDTTASFITVKVDNEEVNATVNVNKTLSKTADIILNTETGVTRYETAETYTLGTSEIKVGERYQLVITGLEQKSTDSDGNVLSDGYTYSGPMTLSFPAGQKDADGTLTSGIIDNSGNLNPATIITIGVDETDGNANTEADANGTIVDVVDPVWEAIDTSVETGAVTLIAKDKYFKECTLDEDAITVYVNNNPSDEITKQLSTPKYVKLDASGNYVETEDETEAIGVKYTLQLGNATVEAGGYTTFTPTNLSELVQQVDGEDVTYQYRTEHGGAVKIVIDADTIVDESDNKSIETIFTVGNMDETNPEVYKIQTIQDTATQTETIIFNVTDRNFYTPTDAEKASGTTNEITTDEISLWIDGIDQTENITITSLTYKEIKLSIDGTVRPVGHQYTLVLKDMVETQTEFIASGRNYRDLSGTLEVKIEKDAVKDMNANTIKPDEEGATVKTISDFVDFINPEVKYTHQSTDIDTGNKKYTMTFTVLDKYYTSGELSLDNLTIKMQNGQRDSDGNAIIYDLKTVLPTNSISSTPTAIYLPAGAKITDTSGNIVEATENSYQIGYKYTLTISNLEQLEVATGLTTADYSGVITVKVDEETITDRSENKNIDTTITTGVDIPGGTIPDDAVVVDVVDPVWEIDTMTVDIESATTTAVITVKGTDTYFTDEYVKDEETIKSELAEEDITLLVDGTEVEYDLELSTVSALTEERLVNNGISGTETETVKYGIQYTVTIKDFSLDAEEFKLKIATKTLIDKSGNTNKEKEINLFNTLKVAKDADENYENAATSGFLGNTNIQRQNIESITFVDGLTDANDTKWDVSAEGDGSILAWYTGSGPYQVYIGTKDKGSLIFANEDSSYLFSYIGYASNITETSTINSLSKLNTQNVTNMSNMFAYCGYRAMTTLDLGNNFETDKVTNMSNMFKGTGQTAMTTFSLGSSFNTTNVENMSGMFQEFAYKLETLTLGSYFNTNKVTDMSNMFNGCGQTSMKTLNLGDNFNTSKVQNMSGMFQDFAKSSTEMTSLDLRDVFYTTSATDMSNMFNGCGTAGMTSLDLGSVFTKIASTYSSFATNCGKSGECVIYAPEAIYSSTTAFKLSTTNAATTITYSTGTINPRYRTEWIKETTDVTVEETISNSTIQITLRGRTLPVPTGETYVYSSNVVSSLPTGTLTGTDVDLIKVFIDGTEITAVVKSVAAATTDGNEILQTITLSGFEETTRNGKPFKEWSGNIELQIAAGTLYDEYGSYIGSDDEPVLNVSKDASGNYISSGNLVCDIADTSSSTANEDGKMFADFIKPEFTYKSSETKIGNGNNGDTKIVTVVFEVADKYFNTSTITADDITIKVDSEEVNATVNVNKTLSKTADVILNIETGVTRYETAETYTLGTSETKVGERYQLVVTGLEQKEYDAHGNYVGDGYTYSGPMTLSFPAGQATEDADGNKTLTYGVMDNSGNLNPATIITIGVDETDGNANSEASSSGAIVDVVDPVIYYNSSSINRTEGSESVTLTLKAEDKYLKSSLETLSSNKDNIIVRIQDENGNDIVNDTTTITKDITITNIQTEYITYRLTLSGFGVYEGKTSVIIPADVIFDNSGNGNKQTEIFVGSSDDATAFKDSLVDFTEPTWEYVTSSINRDVDANNVRTETGTVTLEVKGTDIYFDKDKYFTDASYQLDLSAVKVYINEVLNTNVTVSFATNDDGTIKKEYIEETKQLATDYSRVFKGVKYTLILGNFGTNEGTVRIEIPPSAIKDTSLQGNELTSIDVGNSTWVEDNEPLETTNTNYPAYNAFRNDIVDYIKPVIKYQYAEGTNPVLNRNDETVTITFTSTDTNYLGLDKISSNVITTSGIKIYIDDMQVYGTGADTATDINANLTYETISDGSANGIKYTLTLSLLELNTFLEGEIFERHSGVIKLVFAADQVADISGNRNVETTIIIDNGDGDDTSNGVISDFVNPNIYYQDKYINWEDRYALITLRATDRFYDTSATNVIDVSDITLYEEYETEDGTTAYRDITSNFTNKITITKSNALTVNGNIVGYDYTIRLDDFEEEFKMRINIPAGVIGDTSGNYNDGYLVSNGTAIEVDLDNRRPSWDYVSTDTSTFNTDGKLSFTVKGVDKFLDITNSNLAVGNIKVLKDGELYLDGSITADAAKITVNYLGSDEDEKSKSYKIDINTANSDGTVDIGTYTLAIAKNTLVDEFGNKSAGTTINFSKSIIAYDENNNNTDKYVNVTYHITPDLETVHKSYVHELMSVNTTGTNYSSTTSTYRPSTIAEIYNNGENPLFAEPIYVPSIDGYTISSTYSPKSFAGWAVADEDGNVADGATVYGLYDEIPSTVTHLKAVWQNATIVFVSATAGDDSNDGTLPDKAVKTLATAYNKLNSSGTAENNIIVIMDAVEWNSTATLSGNATITSLYAGVDYRTSNSAELKISSNMTANGDIIFDNIKLYADSTTVSNGSDYLGKGTYTNMLISNYSGDITLGRGVTTPSSNYTFGAIVGGNFGTETTGEFGTHTIRVEAGKYNNIIAGSTLTSSTTTTKSVTHEVVIGNMKDAAISRNDKLTITGYVAIGENEQKCYPSGSSTSSAAADMTYANVTLYSGTFTGDNKFAKATENSVIYLRSMNGQTDGQMSFEMFGGAVTGNIYGGAISSNFGTQNYNTMKFYGGQITGNVFGQSANDTFTGSSTITLQGIVKITGNVYGALNSTSIVSGVVGTGNSTILINSSSVTVSGNIYGGGCATTGSTGYVNGTTNITFRAGTVSNIYGSGYNCGNTDDTNITIEGGTVSGNIFGGAYRNQAQDTSNITVLEGTINGNIYGGNENTSTELENDNYFQVVNVIIGDTITTTIPTVNGNIYGGGKYDKVDVATIELLENEKTTISVFGGSDTDGMTINSKIYLKGMTVDTIYGGGQSDGTVSVSEIYLQSGTATDVYGGGFATSVTQSNVTLEGTATVTSIYGGSNTSGTVDTTKVTLTSGNVTNVYGGGNSAIVGTTNVTLNGITIESIHGGSKDAGVATTTNVTLNSGKVTNVFGGGLDVGATTTNVKQTGAEVTNIYGGNNSGTGSGGETGTANIEIINSTVENVYGGNYLKGTTTNTNINIHGTSTITGKLYGGGYKSAIGGSTTINIAGGTINGDINGGSEQSVVYGDTNINVGYDAVGNSLLTPGAVKILGIIYGAGDTTTEGEITVTGNTHIFMDNNTDYPITYFTASGKEKSIYGSGNGGAIYNSNGTNTDSSTIHIKDFGTSTTPYLFKSIENTGDLYIGKSVVELVGALESVNDGEVGHYYTLNTITNALTIYNNTTLYTQRGFNKVGGFYSYKNQTSTKATVSIDGTEVTTNVDNRLYTLEGINLIFAKKEVNLSNKSTLAKADWGEVTGMAFFGMYKNTLSGTKQYDIYEPGFDYSTGTSSSLFKAGTYVEGQYDSASHSITTDGFYTNVVDETTSTIVPEVINTTNYTYYCDWIIGAETVNYDVDLVASTYGEHAIAELLLNYKYASDYQYAAQTVYTLNQVSTNALKPDVVLVDPTVPTNITSISDNANNKFGLTMETTNSGWLSQALTTMYTTGNGSFGGDTVYKSDASTTAGTIKFKIYNSLNITEERDLGNVYVMLTGQQPISENGNEAYVFKVVIAVNLQAIVDELKAQYTPRFTDTVDTEVSYTADSRVDLTYLLYKDVATSPYASGDYRVISTTTQLPAGTKITLKDYEQDKIYYYHVTGSENETDGTRYLYRLSNFKEMGSTDATYTDSITAYYHTGYALEKYDISIDFIDANLGEDADGDEVIDVTTIEQEAYLELRNSSATPTVKYNNGDKDIKYTLYTGKNAETSETIKTGILDENGDYQEQTSFSVVESLEILLDIDASILEQDEILDTKYYDQIAGIAIQIVGSDSKVRIKTPELQNFKLTNLDTGEIYDADTNGVIRMPVIEGLGMMTGNYKLSITQANVSPGRYIAQVRFYTADDGKYYGTTPLEQKTFNITFISKLQGMVGVETNNDSRVINQSTGLNLVDGSTSSKAVDMTINIANPTDETNIRVELYKRNATYTDLDDEKTYTGTSYTLVDISQYLQGTWEKPSTYSLIAENEYEYMVSAKQTYDEEVELETIEFEKAVKEGISTGEYKLVFKAYSDDTLVQTVKKTFIVTP